MTAILALALAVEPFGCWAYPRQALVLEKLRTRVACCLAGPGVAATGCCAHCYDWDRDGDVDLFDWSLMCNWIK